MSVFINFSNHPTSYWTQAQIDAANRFGEIIDVPFPEIGSTASEEEVLTLADKYCAEIVALSPVAVMVQGEFTFSYAVVSKLSAANITCLAACTKREVTQITQSDGSTVKQSVFKFVNFRKYVN